MKITNTLLLLCICILGCKENPKVKNTYYESGELKCMIEYKTTQDLLYSEYYINGNTKEEGIIHNDIKKGKWKEWYSDGKLKWEGYYKDSIRVVNYNKQIPNIIGLPANAYVDSTYLIRANMAGVHPEDIVIASDNGVIKIANDRDLADFMLTPENKGSLELYLYVFRDNKMCEIGKQKFTILINNN